MGIVQFLHAIFTALSQLQPCTQGYRDVCQVEPERELAGHCGEGSPDQDL